MCGTFINLMKIEKNAPFPLNCGDLIGVGCPDSSSSRSVDGKTEKFVYKIKSPRRFRLQVPVASEEDLLRQDAPTPPPNEPMDDNNDNNDINKTTIEAKVEENDAGSTVGTSSSVLKDPDLAPDSPVVPVKVTRKRIKRLLSDSEDDPEEITAIKAKHKKVKSNPAASNKPNLPFSILIYEKKN